MPIHEVIKTTGGGFLTIIAGTNTGATIIAPYLARWTSEILSVYNTLMKETVIQETTASIKSKCKELTRFDTNEQDIFYSYVDKGFSNIAAFENNWSYILQSTRGEGLKIEKYESIIYFWIRSENELVIVNRLGKNYKSIIEELVIACRQKNINITIKNVDKDQISDLGKIGFKIKDYPWSIYSRMDDNTFPQIVANIQGITQLKPSSLRESHRLNIKRFLRKRKIELKPYDKSMEEVVRQLLKNNAQYLENKNVENKKEVYDAHIFFFDDKLKDVCRFVYEEEGDQIAFALFTVRKGVVYWNALINKDESNLMLYLLWKGMKHIIENSKEDIVKLALQGCETEGQFKWKQGFYPIETLEKVHMSLDDW